MDYWPEVIQVIPTHDYKVYVYFDDGSIRLYDASELVKKGIFQQLQHDNLFIETCTVLNHTLAWTPDKSYSEETCLDIDPINLYRSCPIVDEPIEFFETVWPNQKDTSKNRKSLSWFYGIKISVGIKVGIFYYTRTSTNLVFKLFSYPVLYFILENISAM